MYEHFLGQPKRGDTHEKNKLEGKTSASFSAPSADGAETCHKPVSLCGSTSRTNTDELDGFTVPHSSRLAFIFTPITVV